MTGRRCQSNLPQRPFVGNRVMPLFIAGIGSSAIRDPHPTGGGCVGKTGVENTTKNIMKIKTWWIFFLGGVQRLDGEEGI